MTDPASAREESSTPPRPIGPTGNWVLPSDWPAELYARGIDGVTRIQLQVGIDGRAKNCKILVSSGYDQLDTVVCDRLSRRARFHPALDESGRRTEGVWQNNVVFQFDHSMPTIPQPNEMRMVMVIEPDGSVSDCELAVEQPIEGVPEIACPPMPPFQPLLDSAGIAQRVRLTSTTTVTREIVPEEPESVADEPDLEAAPQ
ncbi:MAG: TonB family protein [Pseudomonadota bacterium]